MYKIPVSNYPNQTFVCSIPINGQNKELRFKLWYNYEAEYWLMSIEDYKTGKDLFNNIPLLSSKGKFFDILCQLGYKEIGKCFMLPIQDDGKSQASDLTLGDIYYMIWGDNDG